jgi:hypothetical protein
MMSSQIEEELQQLERKVKLEGATEENLRAFWRIINRIKLQSQVEDDVFEQVRGLRDKLFNERYPRFLSLRLGLTLTALATFFGATLIWYALHLVAPLVFIAGSFLMLAGTHSWGHWIAGKLVGIGYEYFYLNGPAKFELSLKINYGDYLKASFDSRMIVHSSGALATLLTALTLLTVSLTTSSLEIRGVAVMIMVVIIGTEAISTAGIVSGDLNRARKEAYLKKLYHERRKG